MLVACKTFEKRLGAHGLTDSHSGWGAGSEQGEEGTEGGHGSAEPGRRGQRPSDLLQPADPAQGTPRCSDTLLCKASVASGVQAMHISSLAFSRRCLSFSSSGVEAESLEAESSGPLCFTYCTPDIPPHAGWSSYALMWDAYAGSAESEE